MNEKREILLESGTNELEIVEFLIGTNQFAINVMKVREILNPVPITKVPHSHPNIEGIIELRGEVLPVIDMAKALGFPPSETPQQDKFIVAEFNQQKVVFHVHNVTRIHRISWRQIEKPSQMYQGLDGQVIGVVKLEGKMILLLDFEKMVVDINPETGINVQQVKKLGKRERSNKKIVVAEDSPLLRKLLHDTLAEAGYVLVEFFEDGEAALHYLQAIVKEGKDIEQEVQLVITDIEMPQMDGHHLTKRIREDEKLSKLPVIIFSSLITDDLRHKGEKVGATAQVSKPEVGELVKVIDKYIL
ncbi:response regulator [Anoxybacillus sp. B7M1]|jgi:two-component system, chemotaxis family, chemotaxis protein CheV|uniref:Chemotaxis protein n=1 Tax=Anoxybacteroides rupiense TaxID=311460 RepID=A0ABD5IPX1_9BACL|nr:MULTISPECIES: chemotaxis protein [Anoxybacillus]ANB58200.1 response regulator [Anoxybacillus sp. B2M1]ANB64640.1 response regulator [Anoxybacillus sp. B7M1]KXG10367.1 Chemotaxis protein CheV [Anoxybacillus sp. P3H1B]MBB3906349.1 two-component system chemotaxis response regulator CheV [Anoxybacillus rupiensis]MBS2770668.1 chemotaxis protein CheV [Anoxybacillus rupiensis]